ncbi:MAG: hypothetical protein M3Y41_16865 [Pseudomonadota bacterium]|nr:hypothetical protein [Pseudomonadota bacterium]
MTPEIDLSKLSHAEKDALVRSLLPLVGQLQAALARIAELEARLGVRHRTGAGFTITGQSMNIMRRRPAAVLPGSAAA